MSRTNTFIDETLTAYPIHILHKNGYAQTGLLGYLQAVIKYVTKYSEQANTYYKKILFLYFNPEHPENYLNYTEEQIESYLRNEVDTL